MMTSKDFFKHEPYKAEPIRNKKVKENLRKVLTNPIEYDIIKEKLRKERSKKK